MPYQEITLKIKPETIMISGEQVQQRNGIEYRSGRPIYDLLNNSVTLFMQKQKAHLGLIFKMRSTPVAVPIELLEIYNDVDGYMYWDPKLDQFIDIPGDDGIKRKSYQDIDDFSGWASKINREFIAEVDGEGSIGVTPEGLHYIRCWTNYYPTETNGHGISNKWFIFVRGHESFWQEIVSHDYLGHSTRYVQYVGFEDVWVYNIYFKKEFPGIPYSLMISPSVPLYAIGRYKTTSNAESYEDPIGTHSICEFPSLTDSGNDFCLCEFTGNENYPNRYNMNSSVPRIESVLDVFPWNSESSTQDSPYSLIKIRDDLPCSGGGSAVLLFSTAVSVFSEYIACNSEDIWGNRDNIKFSYIVESLVSHEYEKVIDCSFSYNPVDCGEGKTVIGCNDQDRTFNSQDIIIDGSFTRTITYNEANIPLGLMIEERIIEDTVILSGETIGGIYDGASLPPFQSLPNLNDVESGFGLNGIFSHNTIVSIAARMTAGEYFNYNRGAWLPRSTYDVQPTDIPLSSSLNENVFWNTFIQLVIYSGESY